MIWIGIFMVALGGGTLSALAYCWAADRDYAIKMIDEWQSPIPAAKENIDPVKFNEEFNRALQQAPNIYGAAAYDGIYPWRN
jgi:hypothetical protein